VVHVPLGRDIGFLKEIDCFITDGFEVEAKRPVGDTARPPTKIISGTQSSDFLKRRARSPIGAHEPAFTAAYEASHGAESLRRRRMAAGKAWTPTTCAMSACGFSASNPAERVGNSCAKTVELPPAPVHEQAVHPDSEQSKNALMREGARADASRSAKAVADRSDRVGEQPDAGGADQHARNPRDDPTRRHDFLK
jgi:hypothetical protein